MPETSDHHDAGRWRDLVMQIGEEIGAPLTSALERVYALASTGRIDRKSLRRLRDELERSRQVGLASQQIARFASGRVRQSHERLNLTQTVQNVLVHRHRETSARGIEVRQVLKPVDVIVDPTLLFSLLNTLLDWAMRHARSTIELKVDVKSWPAHARLACRFRQTLPDEAATGFSDTVTDFHLDDMSWRLLEHTAAVTGVVLGRHDEDGRIVAVVEFPRTVDETLAGLQLVELDDGFPSSLNSRPLAGSHVLVIASRRDVRVQVREAVRHMGLVLDFVTSIDEAVAFCGSSIPHAVVYEAILRTERFNHLRADIQRDAPDVAFIEIVEEGSMFEMSSFGGARSSAKVGRDAILGSLPSALVFELTKTL